MFLTSQVSNWMSPGKNEINKKEENKDDTKQCHEINHMVSCKIY